MRPSRLAIPLLAAVSFAFAQDDKGDASENVAPPSTTAIEPLPAPTGSGGSAVLPSGSSNPVTNTDPSGAQTTLPSSTDGSSATSTSSSPSDPSSSSDANAAASNSTSPVPGPTDNVSSSSGNDNKAPLIGVAVAFAVLFAIALAVIAFLLIKRRKDKRKRYHNATYSAPEAGYSDKGASERIDSLQAQLADANKRLTAVQGSLLAAGQKPQTKDDNSLSREFTQINTDVVGWAGNYFKASNDQINLTTELYEFLTEHIPNYQALLGSGKSKQLVVRAIVSQVLQESFEKSAFFGSAISGINPLIRSSSSSPAIINSWRSDTFFLLDKSEDFASQRKAAISTITDKIEQLTYPLAGSKQSFQGDSARYKFLEGIVAKASDFAVSLGKQRANFQLLSEPASCEFGHATMEDVSQQTDVMNNQDGTVSHPLEGRPIQATIFPLLLKYGNESGEGYEHITILSKAKVLI